MKYGRILLGIAAVLGTMTLNAQANIYVDETFEGTSAFVDQNWPVAGDITIHPTPAIVAVKGAFLRAYLVGTNDYRTPKPVINNSGTITSSRFFLGAQSLQLASGQSVAVPASPTYVGNSMGEYRVVQFAVSCTPETLALPSGTEVGRFDYDWSVASTTTVEATLTLLFRVSSAGKLEIFCVNTSSVLATIDGGTGSWALVTLLTQIRPGTTGTNLWNAYDPITATYKNPVIQGLELAGGIHVYINGNTEVVHVTDNQVGTGWGNNNSGDAVLNSVELGWELAATNGGTLFIDDLYWDAAYHNIDGNVPRNMNNEGYAEEQAARMKAFDLATSEGAPPVLKARNWEILE